ncbi:hypothetical protein KC952_02010 [Candidatus Saccharibacteria bacterium]|nr:hypothetical protein [Candidatus Saccharibacteria bacterium]
MVPAIIKFDTKVITPLKTNMQARLNMTIRLNMLFLDNLVLRTSIERPSRIWATPRTNTINAIDHIACLLGRLARNADRPPPIEIANKPIKYEALAYSPS